MSFLRRHLPGVVDFLLLRLKSGSPETATFFHRRHSRTQCGGSWLTCVSQKLKRKRTAALDVELKGPVATPEEVRDREGLPTQMTIRLDA